MNRPARILPIIIYSQFTGASLWFSGNAVMLDLQRAWGLSEHATAYATSAVILGFVAGTLLFAFFNLADRYSPRRVFFASTLAGALANAALLVAPPGPASLLLLRFATGFCLAGIYPVGMKIAAGWYHRGLGRALGYLVGALVLGTAFPHLLRASGTELHWQPVVSWVSLLALSGGVAMLALVPDGPHLPQASAFDPRALASIFRSPRFRASACGYFGHMWELYTFWAFVPLLLQAYGRSQGLVIDVSLWSFAIIAAGALACAVGGVISSRVGSAPVAAAMLAVSAACCLLSPLMFESGLAMFIGFLLLWGLSVSSDSPQFSALNAAYAPREYVGSALTVVNSIGFLITIPSILLADLLLSRVEPRYLFWMLVPGPILGLWAFRPLLREALGKSPSLPKNR
jgi:MFS family permease